MSRWDLSAPLPPTTTFEPGATGHGPRIEAATHLRGRQPRTDVTGTGRRRYLVSLTEADADALKAHRGRYRVVVVGNLDTRGTRRSLGSVGNFGVLSRPGAG